jgi:hypothetical protein
MYIGEKSLVNAEVFFFFFFSNCCMPLKLYFQSKAKSDGDSQKLLENREANQSAILQSM